MTDHLPECDYSDNDLEFPESWTIDCCICDRLHACEQRVRLEDDDYAYVAAQAEAEGRWRGWREALDAAREAVSPQNICSAYLVSLYPEEQRIAISALELSAKAIDALREKP